MAGVVVIALYRPKPGRARALEEILAEHVPTLRQEELATSRPVLLLRSTADDTYLEIFELADADAADRAHANERVMAIWRRIAEVSEIRRLADLAEAARRFPQFAAVEGVVI